MESIVFQDSPLAQYLEGEGQADNEWPSVENTSGWIDPDTSSEITTSFAPQGPIRNPKSRRKPPLSLNLEGPSSKGLVAQIHNSCSSAFHSRLGGTENAHFLEKFRYIIVASQLLSDIQNPTTYNRQTLPPPRTDTTWESNEEQDTTFTWSGLLLTNATAFALAWSIRWLRNTTWACSNRWRISLVIAVVTIAAVVLYAYSRRQKLVNLRVQAGEGASSVTSNAQNFDAVASAALTLIQEVELVSRGYRIGNPLPPVTRLEEQSQSRRCVRLRRSLHRALESMLSTHYQAYQSLRPLAVEVDLEKYYDIYEISRTDMDEAKEFASAEIIDTEEANSLTALKIALQRLHMIRKLFLCSLLALDADGGKSDFPRWAVATDTMRHISAETENVTRTIDEILREEESFPVPPTPQIPLTPGRQRMRSQIRKLSSLSQGIRALQAKMHVLRDESDKLLENTDETAQSGPNLFLQYESIGEDLKSLLRDWEQGRVALVSNIDRSHNRRSSSLPGNADPPSPTPSLGCRTVVESSPTGPLHPYSGHGPTSRSRSSTTTSSSGEEVFEAVALPRQRSTLTREERLAKLKEERVRQAILKGKADANTHMLKELEMVIRLRPRGRTTGRMTST